MKTNLMALACAMALSTTAFALITMPASAADDTACAALADMRLANTNIFSATTITDREDLPAFCSVVGFVRPAINFEVRMPLESWNGGFYMAGCGGFCGTLGSDNPNFINAMNPGLTRGYAVSTMDGGHWGTGSTDARWAYNDRLAEVDWGDRAVRETANVSKALIAAFYGGEIDRSIFQGCSTGGRQANMLAVRDPDLFDGIINGAPALDYPGLVATWMASVVQQNTTDDGSQIISAADIPFIQETVYGQCDAVDGLEDGLIDDPRACEIDWSEAMCTEGQNSPCLTDQQAETLTAWYQTGATNSAGDTLYPATVPYGSEPFWWLWLTGNADGGGRLVPAFNQNFLQFMAFPDDPGEGYTAMDFDLDSDPERLALMSSIYNSDDPDLSAFAEAGGKMITWHGWADAIVPPGKTVDYYEQVAASAGSMDAARNFNRLFMIPGVDHCGILSGPGINQNGLDLITVMEAWLDGTAPEQITTIKADGDGNTIWTRPVCAWPQKAVYDGSGDPNTPESFTCQ